MVATVGDFRLGEWLVQPSLDRLSRGGESVHVRPKLMDVLGVLAQHAGDVVSNDEIIATVWAREFMAESVLTRSITELRHILGDHATDPRFIETIAKRGYRLVAPVEWVHGPKPAAADARRKRILSLAALGAAVLLVATGAFIWWGVRAVRPAGPLDPKLAVVAIFENRTGDPSLDELGRMAADRISEGLMRTGVVKAVPSSTVFHLDRLRARTAGSLKDPVHAISEATRAGIVVSGAYYLHGHEILIQAQIADAVAGTQVYEVEPATAPRDEPTEALEAARRRIVDAIAARYLNSAFDFLSWELKPPSVEAYKEFLIGRELFRADNRGSAHHLLRALELDPDFVMPQFYLSDLCWTRGDYPGAGRYLDALEKKLDRLSPLYRRYMDSRRAMLAGRWEESVSAMRDASRLAPTNSFIALQLGVLAVFANHPREATETFARPSLIWEPMPDLAQTWSFWYFRDLTAALHMLGEHERELAEARRGIAVSPAELYFRKCEVCALASLGRLEDLDRVIAESSTLAPHFEALGDVMVVGVLELRAHGEHDASLKLANQAVDWYRSRLVDEPASVADPRMVAYCLLLAEKWEEANSAYEELAAQHPDDIEFKGHDGAIAARRGDRKKALRVSEELRRIDRPYLFGEHTYYRACIAAQLGEKGLAVALLRESFAQGKRFDLYLHRDLDLEPLRGYPPFEELVKPKG